MHYQYDWIESTTPRTEAAWVEAWTTPGGKRGQVRAARMRDFAEKLEHELLVLTIKLERLREEKTTSSLGSPLYLERST